MVADTSIFAIHLGALTGSVTIGPAARIDREEAAWIERARRGEEQAFRWLLQRYRERIVRLAAVTLGSPADAEDAAQEAFIKAFRTLHQYRASGAFYSWLCRIAIRTCIDHRRRRHASEIPSDTLVEQECVIDFEPVCDEAILVGQLLQELAPPMRAALVLREVDGLEYDEIAASLAIPVGTVRSRLNSARAQFKRLLESATREEDNAHVR